MKNLLVIILILVTAPLYAAPIAFTNGKWETTFDCTEQYNNNTIVDSFKWDCDDIGEGTDNFGLKFGLSDGVTNNWTQSTAYPNQYYYSGSQLVAPNEEPAEVTLGNVLCLGSSSFPRSSPLAEYEFSFEDVDSLGSDHLYVYSLVDPDTQVPGYIAGWFEHNYYYAGDTQTSILPAANNALGTGKGARFWKGDGKNGPGSQSMSVTFPSAEKEIWIRWYSRYQEGFNWRSQSQDKMIYLHTAGTSHFLGFYSNEFDKFRITSQEGGALYTYEGQGVIGWNQVMVDGSDGPAAKRSDGKYHCYEIHLKMDTGETLGVPNMDGVAEIWIDGVLAGSNKTAYLSFQNSIGGSNADSVLGWTYFTFDNNQDFVENGDFNYMDFDDIVIIKDPLSTELKDDGNGNLFIGPIGSQPQPSSGGKVLNGFGSGRFGR